MDLKERDALIAEKEAEIKRLKDEIGQLRYNSIAKFTTEKCYYIGYVGGSIRDSRYGVIKGSPNNSGIWEELKKIGCMLHKRTGRSGGTPKVREMAPEQVKLSAQMIDEMVVVWNKYFEQAHPEKEGEVIRR